MKKIIMLAASVGCAHVGDLTSSDGATNSPQIQFPSGASVTLAEGMTGLLNRNHLQVSIAGESIDIHLLEYEASLEDSMNKAHLELYPSDQRKPQQTVSSPEPTWDAVRIEIYAQDQAEKTLQIVGKRKGPWVWVMVLQGTQGEFGRRSAQIITLLGSLKVPGQEVIDLSAAKPLSIAPAKKMEELEQFTHHAMTAAHIPGLAIAVVEEGKVAYAKGFGVSDLEEKNPVNMDTRFMIGSTSKSMTTFLISKLADEGMLSWSDKVVDLDPTFLLKDHSLSKSLRMEDLACACTGIPRHDFPLVLNYSHKNASDLLHELSYLEQTTKFRETFQYNNQLLAAVGFIAAKKARPALSVDQAYHELMADLVFKPMNMHRTTTIFDKAISEGNYARSYRKNFYGQLEPIDFSFERFAEYVGPAGGIWSSVSDMTKYAMTELNKGVNSEGKSVISEENLLLRRKEQVRINETLHYGLGWMVGKNVGLDVVHHGGSTFGFSSEFVLFPKLNRAIIILSNSAYGSLIQGPLFNKIMELWFEKDFKSDDLLKSNLQFVEQSEKLLKSNVFDLNKTYMKRYIGVHFNPEIGKTSIIEKGKNFYVTFGKHTFALAGYREPSGVEKLMIIDVPLIGLTIDPVFSGKTSIKMTQGQEVYEFSPHKK